MLFRKSVNNKKMKALDNEATKIISKHLNEKLKLIDEKYELKMEVIRLKFKIGQLEKQKNEKSFHDTIIRSKEWKDWCKFIYKKQVKEDFSQPMFDVDESQECNLISDKHWKAFANFIKINK